MTKESSISKRTKKDEESLSIDFWGLKFNAVNPSNKTFTVLIIFVVFVIILFLILKTFLLPLLALGNTRNLFSLITKRLIK